MNKSIICVMLVISVLALCSCTGFFDSHPSNQERVTKMGILIEDIEKTNTN